MDRGPGVLYGTPGVLQLELCDSQLYGIAGSGAGCGLLLLNAFKLVRESLSMAGELFFSRTVLRLNVRKLLCIARLAAAELMRGVGRGAWAALLAASRSAMAAWLAN